MIAQYTIKMDGKWYKAGEEISSANTQNKESEQKKYTKTDINRMSTDELRKMAMNTGVEGADTMTGKELKEYLCSVFNL